MTCLLSQFKKHTLLTKKLRTTNSNDNKNNNKNNKKFQSIDRQKGMYVGDNNNNDDNERQLSTTPRLQNN